ncbi:MAG: esterase, partial [Mariniphaga sp.]|nr:esterase [Mariniphaga sp.]
MKTINYTFSLLIIFTFVYCQPAGSNLEIVTPESVGFNSSRLELIDQHIQSYINEDKVPGGVFLIARK